MNTFTAMDNCASIHLLGQQKRKHPHMSIAAFPIFLVHTDELVHANPNASIMSNISVDVGSMARE